VDFLISNGASFFFVFVTFTFYVLNILTISIPTAVLFASFFLYERLSIDNEILAMKSLGINYITLTMPIIISIFMISFCLVFLNHFITPSINHYQKFIIEKLIKNKPLSKFKEKSILKLNNYYLYADKVGDNSLVGINIYKFEDKVNNKKINKNIALQDDKYPWHITARSSIIKTFKNGIQFTIKNGYWQNIDFSNINNITHMNFGTYIFFLPFESVKTTNHSINSSEIQSIKLIKIIKKYKKLGLQTIIYERDLWFRWVFTFSPFAFAFIALPIGLMIGKNGKATGFIINLCIIIFYYILFICAIHLCKKNHTLLKIVIWSPNFILTIIGIYLCKQMVKK
jgi:lipopolysaccharide export LptBFGC system permease protein LptF